VVSVLSVVQSKRLEKDEMIRRLVLLTIAAAALAGCRSNYTVDLRNQTPQPVYAQIFERHQDGRTPLLAATRLGPGDRAAMGPVRGLTGRVGLVVDTKPNPEGPLFIDLAPGMSIFNIHQSGDATAGPLEIREVTR
jgi:hypothetical protein